MMDGEKIPTVLLADDDEALLKALSRQLSDYGYNVLTANDGYNALAMTQEHRPDVLVLDLNMPAGDGFSVHQRIIKMPDAYHPPIIYMTADESNRLDSIAAKLGAIEMLHKPFRLQELFNVIDEATRGRAA